MIKIRAVNSGLFNDFVILKDLETYVCNNASDLLQTLKKILTKDLGKFEDKECPENIEYEEFAYMLYNENMEEKYDINTYTQSMIALPGQITIQKDKEKVEVILEDILVDPALYSHKGIFFVIKEYKVDKTYVIDLVKKLLKYLIV